MVVNKTNKTFLKNTKQIKKTHINKQKQLKLKDFNFSTSSSTTPAISATSASATSATSSSSSATSSTTPPQNCNLNQKNIASSIDSHLFTQNETINMNLNYNQSESNTTSVQENLIEGIQTDIPSKIFKLIEEKSITHAKIQCAISNYITQINDINAFKNNPESAKIPSFLNLKIKNTLKSRQNEDTIKYDVDRILLNSLIEKQNKLLELENLNRNFIANFWNASILPALQFAQYAMNFDTFFNIYDTSFKNTKFNFFLTQQKHEILKNAKLKKYEMMKEEKMQQITLTKGDLNKLANKINQLSLLINSTKTENQKLKKQLISSKIDTSKKDQGKRATHIKATTGPKQTKNSKQNGSKRNTVVNRK